MYTKTRSDHFGPLKKLFYFSTILGVVAFAVFAFSAPIAEASVQVKQCIGGSCQLTACDPDDPVPSCVDSCSSNSDCQTGDDVSCDPFTETKHCTTANGGSCWCEPDDEDEPDPDTTKRLNVVKIGTGEGTVRGSGINCGNDCRDTKSTSGSSYTWTLKATPERGSTFDSWSKGQYSQRSRGSCLAYNYWWFFGWHRGSCAEWDYDTTYYCGTYRTCPVSTSSSTTIEARFSKPAGNLTHESSTASTIALDYSYSNGSNVSLFRDNRRLTTFAGADRSGSYTDAGLSSNTSYTYRLRNGTSTSSTLLDSVTASTAAEPADVTISADDTSLEYGGRTNIRWQPSNATSCSASGAWSGSKASGSTVHTQNTGALVGPDSYTYSIQCFGPSGSSPVRSATISVAEQPEITSVNLSADPVWARKGGEVELTWRAPSANFCTLRDDNGNTLLANDPYSPPDNSYATTIEEVTTYTVDCRNTRTASLEDSVTVYVLPVYEEF